MMKNPLEMNYDELEKTLDHLLKNMDLPCSIHYHNDTINYHHYTRRRLLCSSLYRLIESTIFFQSYIKKRIYPYRKMEIFKSFRIYFSLFKIGLTDLILQMNGSGDDRLPAHYIIAAMLYDASCDIPQYKPYLKDFNDFIMFDKEIVPRDEYLRLFNESMTYIKNAVDQKTYETFIQYIKIEHISQIFSMHQVAHTSIPKDTLFKITLAKGGISVLAGMHLLLPNLSQTERQAIFEIGGICQIFEDIHDMKEDSERGIQTLPNQQLIGYQEIRQLYCGTVNNLIKKCNLDTTRPNITLDIFHLLLHVIVEKRYAPKFNKEKTQTLITKQPDISKEKYKTIINTFVDNHRFEPTLLKHHDLLNPRIAKHPSVPWNLKKLGETKNTQK